MRVAQLPVRRGAQPSPSLVDYICRSAHRSRQQFGPLSPRNKHPVAAILLRHGSQLRGDRARLARYPSNRDQPPGEGLPGGALVSAAARRGARVNEPCCSCPRPPSSHEAASRSLPVTTRCALAHPLPHLPPHGLCSRSNPRRGDARSPQAPTIPEEPLDYRPVLRLNAVAGNRREVMTDEH